MPSYFGWFFISVLALLALKILNESQAPKVQVDTDIPDVIEIQDFTPQSLSKYDGVKHPKILVGVMGKVYDVTAGGKYYGPDGPYAFIAGRDASRPLAKHSFDTGLLTPLDQPIDTLEDLTESEKAALTQWSGFFAGKYAYCGKLVNN